MSEKTRRPFTVEDALSIKDFHCHSLIRFSPDGKRLAYVLDDQSGEEPCAQLWVTLVSTGKARRILSKAITAWGPSWSPTGEQLAFYADTGEGLQLWVWQSRTGKARRVADTIIASEDWARFEVPRWLPDGSAVICKLANPAWLETHRPCGKPIETKDALSTTPSYRPTVRYWESGSNESADEKANAETSAALNTGDLARIDIASGRIITLAKVCTSNWAVSPDSKMVAFVQQVGETTAGYRFEIHLLPSSGGKAAVLVKDLEPHGNNGPAISWSPDNSMIAYRMGGQVSVVSVTNAEARLLLGIEGNLYSLPNFDPPLWGPDSSFVMIAKDQDTVWKLPITGEMPIDLMSNRGKLVALSTILTPGGSTGVWSPDGRIIIVLAVDHEKSEVILVKVALTGDGILDKSSALKDQMMFPRFSMDISATSGCICSVFEDATHPADIWIISSDFSAPQQLTNVNPHVHESMFAVPRLLDWTDPNNRACHSAFFPPPERFGPPPWPTVFWVYEQGFSWLIARFGGGTSPMDNIHILTTQGFAVCVPDTYISKEHPAQSTRDALQCAVKNVVDEGLADPKRLGIFGHSFGGTTTNVAITGLDYFAAAVSSVGWANLISAFGAGQDGRSYWARLVEQYPGRMGVPPWENPERYIENSPLFFLDRVTTPLLLLHGTEDVHSQAWEMFNGLRRLNKPAAIAVYEGEGHVLERRANIIDRWQRILAWFDKYMGTEKV